MICNAFVMALLLKYKDDLYGKEGKRMTARKIGIIGYLLCLCLFLLPCDVLAVATADEGAGIPTGSACKMTLSYCKNGIGVENLSVKLYQVASVSEHGEYIPETDFQTLNIDWGSLTTTNQLNMTCTTLESHILAQNVNVDFEKVTNQSGVAVFESLKPGLYLVGGAKSTYNSKQYTFQSVLVSLPAMDENGLWQHHITIAPKGEVNSKEEENRQFKVVKLWNDASQQEQRPDSIEVELFKDGTSYQVIMLSKDNNWSYGWTAPKDGAKWMVAERNVPAGYTVTVEQRDTAFVLTNTCFSSGAHRENGPGTGDSQNILLYGMVFFISGIALILLSAGRRRGQ